MVIGIYVFSLKYEWLIKIDFIMLSLIIC
jgi:hypothetical protein